MNVLVPVVAVSPLRQRLIDEMEVRRFGREMQRNYPRCRSVRVFLGRSPDTVTAEEVRRFQVEQSDQSVPVQQQSLESGRNLAKVTGDYVPVIRETWQNTELNDRTKVDADPRPLQRRRYVASDRNGGDRAALQNAWRGDKCGSS